MAVEAKLSKKQQKALKHRSRGDKGKGKEVDEPAAFPEAENLDDDGVAAAEAKAKAKALKSQQDKEKKAKKAALDDGLPYAPIDEPAASSKPKEKTASKKRKREDAGGEDGANADSKTSTAPKVKKAAKSADSKARYIVFVGNLPYKVEVEDIIAHFEEPCGEKPSVRLLTSKAGGTSKNPAIAAKTKGCAFVEFKTSAAVQAALHLHQSMFVSSKSSAKRKINVELTAGGGGNSDNRKQKLAGLKERLQKQREKHKTEADIAREQKEEQDKATRAEWQKNEAANKAAAARSKRPPKFISGANSTKLG